MFNNLSIKTSIADSTPVQAISRNMYEIEIKNADKEPIFVCGLVSGHKIITVAHAVCDSGFVSVYKDKERKHLVVDNAAYSINYINFINDVAVISLPDKFPTPFKNLSKFIAPTQYHVDLLDCKSRKGYNPDLMKDLLLVTPLGCIDIVSERTMQHTTVKYKMGFWEDKIATIDTTGCIDQVATKGLSYAVGCPGLCGSVLANKSGNVVGFHTSGLGTNSGFSIIWDTICKREIYEILAADSKFFLDIDISSKALENFSGIKLQANPNIQVPKKSNLIPSPLYKVFETTRSPANLTWSGPHTVKDIEKKSFIPVKTVTSDKLSFAASILSDYIEPFCDIDMKEVIKGNELLAGLNKDSSNGFGCLGDKEDYIDFEKGEYLPHTAQHLKEMESEVKAGKFPLKDFLWYSTLKDEIRNDSKEGKPRSFRVSTLFTQLWTKTVTGQMVSNLIRTRKFNGIMVGVNPFKEWPSIYESLTSCEGVWAGDIGSYDGAMLPQIQDLINKIIKSKYKGKHPEMLDVILQNLINCPVGINDDMYLTTHSMPSGSFLTSMYNSLVNKVYTCIWYFTHFPKPSKQHFYDNVVDYAYGDDKLNGVKKKD